MIRGVAGLNFCAHTSYNSVNTIVRGIFRLETAKTQMRHGKIRRLIRVWGVCHDNHIDSWNGGKCIFFILVPFHFVTMGA